MGRFRSERFNPWTNLNKMLDLQKKKAIQEDVQELKSEVNIVFSQGAFFDFFYMFFLPA